MNRSQTTTVPRILLSATLRWPTAARLAIAFADMGCHVEVICPRQHPATKTHAVRRIHVYTVLNPLESLRAAIQSVTPDMVIPCDDTAAVHLQQLYMRVGTASPAANVVRGLIARSLGTPEACTFATARGQLIALAAEEGVRVPVTTVIATAGGLYAWLAQYGFPAVIKVDRTWGGQGVVIVRNQEQARIVYQRMTARPHIGSAVAHMFLERDPSLLLNTLRMAQRTITLQSFIQGTPANRAAACWQGKVLGGISVEAIRTQHVTGPATVVRVIEHSEMSEATDRLAQRLGITGMWGLDFILEESTGAAYLIEMNPRATPISHLSLGPGRNLPAAIYAQLTGGPPRVLPATIGQDVIALFPGEHHRDPASAWLRSGYHDLPKDDPALVQDSLDRPWSERGLIARLWSHLRPMSPIPPARLKTPADAPVSACDARDRSAVDGFGENVSSEPTKKNQHSGSRLAHGSQGSNPSTDT